MKYFILAFKKWNDINGRANLKEFWFYNLFFYIFYFVSYSLDLYIHNGLLLSTGEFVSEDFEDGGIVTLIYWIINIIPSITVSIRRLHDVNKSGWNLLWSLTIIGIVYVIFLHILRGTKGDNDYGSPSNNRPDYKDMNEYDKQKEEEVYNKINELVSQVKSEVDEEELNENKSGSFENDSNENKYFVKDTVTGETLKVNKEDYQKVTEDYLKHMKDTALYRMPGLSGLQVYLKDRPNISRIFNELINYVDDGNSVREYLEKANIIDNEDSWIIYGALLDISKFYKNLLDKEEIPLVRKDYNTCIEAIKILE